jgi:curved DNA-binding protein CbpA
MEDRREFRRYSCQSACEIRIYNDIYKGVVVDYSDGLGIITENAPLLKKGAVADIRVLNSSTEMKGEVAWEKRTGEEVKVGFKRVGNLKGNLKAYKLTDLLIGIQRGTRTGVLEIVSNGIIKRVYIRNGDMIFADSGFQDERLGEMLVLEGKITIEQFNQASERLLETGEKLGKILVDMSCLTPPELYQAVRHQVEKIILNLFTIEEGEFEFKEGPLPTDEVITLIISVANIIYRGTKKIESLSYIKEMCPSPETILGLSQDPMDIFQAISLEKEDKEILHLINGRDSLNEILSLSPLTDFEILKTISALLRIGIIILKEQDGMPSMVSAGDLLEEQADENADEFLAKVEEMYAQCESADYYSFLGIDRKAAEEEIHNVYYRISKQFHPDRHFVFPEHDIKGKLIKISTYAAEANAVLSDTEKREKYDQNISKDEGTDVASHESEAAAADSTIQIIDDNSMDSVVNGFQDEGEEKPPEDSETHYDLGIAYIEMALVDDAIKEFRIAADDPSRRTRCCKVIAGCYTENGDYQMAIEELNKLVSELSADNEEYLDIKYDLADAYVKNNEHENALNLYNEINSQDAEYRDIAAKIETVNIQLSDREESIS